ncbi:MAG: signal peptidase II [Acidimicrobiales bacterium]
MRDESAASKRRRRLALVGGVALVVVGLDQITKSLAVSHLSHHEIHIVGPIALRLEYNSGVAFSIGTSLTGPIIVVAIVLVLAVAWFARRVPTTLSAVGVGLILGGAVGNLADRLFRGNHGAVVDFLYTKYWPTFNLADSSVVCGCALVAWSFLKAGSPRHVGDASVSGLSASDGGGPAGTPPRDLNAERDRTSE